MSAHGTLVVACVVAALAAAFDWRSRAIPNWLTLGALAAAPLLHAASGEGASDVVGALAGSLVGALVCALVPALLVVKGVAGAGDLKLLACLGGILGARTGVEAELYAFATATFAGLALLAYGGWLFGSLRDAVVVAARPGAAVTRRRLVERLSTRFALGPSIFLGVALAAWLHWRAV